MPRNSASKCGCTINYSRRGCSYARRAALRYAPRSHRFQVSTPTLGTESETAAKDQNRGDRLLLYRGRGQCHTLSTTARTLLEKAVLRPDDRRSQPGDRRPGGTGRIVTL